MGFVFVHPQEHKLFKIPTVLSKYAVTEDRWDQQQLITAILKKYDTSNLKIGKRYSVNTISNKSGQQAVLKTTFWKEDTGEIYFNTEMQKPTVYIKNPIRSHLKQRRQASTLWDRANFRLSTKGERRRVRS